MIAAMSASSRSLTLATVLAISGSLLAAPGCIIVGDDDDEDGGVLAIFNDDPEFFIEEIYVAPAGVDYGGNEVPGGLGPDESLEIDLGCDLYDVLIIDELDEACEVFDLDLCGLDAEISYPSCDVLNATGDAGSEGGKKNASPKPDAAKPDVVTPPADTL
jgi:hypothetical protein